MARALTEIDPPLSTSRDSMISAETQGSFSALSCPVCLLCNYSDRSSAMADSRAWLSVTMEKTNTLLKQAMGLEVLELPDFVSLHNTA